MRISTTSNVLKVLNQHLIAYPTPVNLNYMYNWGSLAGIMLSVQIVTGLFLAMHYVPSTLMAFDSVIHLMTDVPSGMILRYAHANGASLFFIVVYMHIFRGMYYSSGNQPRELVWITGVVLLLLMIITAFLGYVLPWGWLMAPNANSSLLFESLSGYGFCLMSSSVFIPSSVKADPKVISVTVGCGLAPARPHPLQSLGAPLPGKLCFSG